MDRQEFTTRKRTGPITLKDILKTRMQSPSEPQGDELRMLKTTYFKNSRLTDCTVKPHEPTHCSRTGTCRDDSCTPEFNSETMFAPTSTKKKLIQCVTTDAGKSAMRLPLATHDTPQVTPHRSRTVRCDSPLNIAPTVRPYIQLHAPLG